MISVADTLEPDRIRLSLQASQGVAAIDEIAGFMRNVPAVLDWEALHAGLHRSAPCLSESDGEFAICLPHSRTDAVKSMVMAIGRSITGVTFENCILPVRYIFCIGTPKAMASDYLRIVGLLARILKTPTAEEKLREASNPVQFLHQLSSIEAKL